MRKLIVFLLLLCLFLYFYPQLSFSARESEFVSPLGKVFSGSLFGRLITGGDPSRLNPSKLTLKPFKVPILLYHFVEEVTDERDTLRRSMAVTPLLFGDQLKALEASGYESVTFSELAAAYQGEGSLPEKPVIITFDDGHADLYFNALPLLVKYDFKATIFIITGRLNLEDFLTESQLEEMVKSGYVRIGSHTISHEYLGVISTWAQEEIFESKRFLEDRFGVKVESFSYPGGSKNRGVKLLVKRAGYKIAVGVAAGVATEKSDPLDLPRLRVGNLSGRELLGMIER